MISSLLNPCLVRSGVWIVKNSEDKRVYVVASPNCLFGMSALAAKLSRREHKLPPLLIKDYIQGKCTIEVVEQCVKDDMILQLIKLHWITHYKSLGWTCYNSKDIKRWFVSIEPIEHYSIDGSESRVLVHVKLVRRGSRYSSSIVGVFGTIKEAKAWAKWAYGEYDKYSIDRMVVANNALTKSTLINPLLTDPLLAGAYKALYTEVK